VSYSVEPQNRLVHDSVLSVHKRKKANKPRPTTVRILKPLTKETKLLLRAAAAAAAAIPEMRLLPPSGGRRLTLSTPRRFTYDLVRVFSLCSRAAEQSKEAGIRTLVALDDQGGEFSSHLLLILAPHPNTHISQVFL
jgi:hypothetical protein